jgi:hypothetical protein
MKENNKTTKKERAGLDKGVMSRIYIVYVFLLLIAIGIFLRIVQLQIFKANELNIIAEKREFRFDDNIEAMRGSIYSEDGRLMATSVPVFEVRMDVALPDIKDSVPIFSYFLYYSRLYHLSIVCHCIIKGQHLKWCSKNLIAY